ncbi:sigma-70 family RNA polymerase sigma factor [Calidifontibacter sp. DB0510]|uniref:Sigma-70 family RNA polymerase sigma factor n=1 Tax=Metallococcus carri TaxID=1656884 RepID=A0A967AXS2_9MICO|nr:sigma-70 family RNA polymerase sigma factor [Metallococcus carri]NHN54698.1 sigma-70 family RNA polymerase sigma factor [Metallococcus carri]NOP37043.1 sigma-70 family RNA polymerase sigma factor [Calidifontibacter sp. DB2511S]
MRAPFERAVEHHGATVLRVCRAVLGGDPEAEDAWSETFLAALRAWPSLAEDANVEAWLVTIAHRKALDIVRRRRTLPIDQVPACTVDPDPATALTVWEAVRSLPERQRLAVAYHHLGGLPYAEVAALVGGSPEAARRAAADGMKTLRTVLKEDE